MKRIIYFTFLFLLALSHSYSQNTSPKHSFDVLNYKLYFNIYNCFKTPFPKSFNATNEIYFRVDSTLNTIRLNAVNTSLVIDSVKLPNGTSLNFTHSNNFVTITLDRTYNVNELITVKIFYRHNHIADNAFYVANGMVFTDNPPEGARKWFPCWDKPSDKAKVDVTVKVPLNVRLGSNGRLADSTLTGDTIYYHWISRDPVATYLVVLTGKVNYNMDIKYWHKLSNPADSIPTLFYFNAGENINPVKNIVNNLLDYFSLHFGDYPFEKNGFAAIQGGSGFQWAGMENQTLISLCANCWTENLVVHEFAHQWFGDLVTCGTWADVWLNESFATYMEAFWRERTGGYSGYKTNINSKAASYFSNNSGFPIYNPQWANITPHIDSLYHYGIIYCKGACVLHLLRYTIGDSLFFASLKSYATDSVSFKYQSAVTADFITKVNSVSGQNLNWFFDAWLNQPNHPVYQNSYTINNLGGGNYGANFLVKQIQTNAGFFPIPVTVKINFTNSTDTTIRVMNNLNNQMFNFTFNKQPSSVQFDPANEIILKVATTIGVKEIASEVPDKYELGQNYPNPFNSMTNVKFKMQKPGTAEINLYDISGKLVNLILKEKLGAGEYEINFNADKLPSGIYFYRLTTNGYVETRKMILLK